MKPWDIRNYSKHVSLLLYKRAREHDFDYFDRTWRMGLKQCELLAREGCLLPDELFELGKLGPDGFTQPAYEQDWAEWWDATLARDRKVM